MTVEELQALVEGTVQDASLVGRILGLFNQCLTVCAQKVDLPALDAVATVKTSTTLPYVALPQTYMKGLYWVGSASQGRRIGKLHYDFISFLRKYPDPALNLSGEVTDCAVKGSNLYYQGIPTTQDTLTLHFFAKPTVMEMESDEPECIPDFLQVDLLVNFACWRLFSLIEDGLEQKKVDTMYYKGMFDLALAQLEAWAPKKGEPQYINDEDDSIYVR